MAVTLGDVVRQIRLRHPALSRDNVPTNVLAEALSEYQRYLIRAGAERDKALVVDRLSISLDLGDTDPGALLMTGTNFGVITGVPAQLTDTGVGIDLDGSDLAVEDATEDLTVRYDDGFPLPAFVAVLGGTVNFQGSTGSGGSDPSSNPVYLAGVHGGDFKIVGFSQRLNPPYFPSGYLMDGKLYLCGTTADWASYSGLDIRYIPVPANLTSETTEFRLPDMARTTLVAFGTVIAAEWAIQRGATIDLNQYAGAAIGAEAAYLGSVSLRNHPVKTLRRNR